MQSLINVKEGNSRELQSELPLTPAENYVPGTLPVTFGSIIQPSFYDISRQSLANACERIPRVGEDIRPINGKSPVVLGNLRHQMFCPQNARMDPMGIARVAEAYKVLNMNQNHQNIITYFPRNISGGTSRMRSDVSSKSSGGRHNRKSSLSRMSDSDSTSNSISTGNRKQSRGMSSVHGRTSDQLSKKRDRDSSDDNDGESGGFVETKRLTRNQREQRR
jgi:hypothetical protein